MAQPCAGFCGWQTGSPSLVRRLRVRVFDSPPRRPTFAVMPASHRPLPALLPALLTLMLPLRAEMPADVRGILENRCFDCHADGAKKGGVAFDGFESEEKLLASGTRQHSEMDHRRRFRARSGKARSWQAGAAPAQPHGIR